jgi:hypothetical protein
MALKFDWWWMIPAVALAVWNKESFLFFIPALYPLLRQRCSRTVALTGIGILSLAGSVVYFLLRMRYQQNPGGTVVWHGIDHIYYICNLRSWRLFETTQGLNIPQMFNPLSIALIVWTAWRGWRFLPRAIQRHAQIAAIINFPLYFLFCHPGEMRNFSLLYVALLLLLAANLTQWASGHIEFANRPLTGPVEPAE